MADERLPAAPGAWPAPAVPVPAGDPTRDPAGDPIGDVASPRARKFLRIFLMAAGGLAAPCLALAAFFLTGSGGADTPAATSAAIPGGRATPTTAKSPASTPVTQRPSTAATSTTTTTQPVPAHPSRDPFVPLVTQAPAGGPAR
jgi:hypothetical protein